MVKQRDALSVIVNDTELGNTAFDPSDHAGISKDLDKAKEKTCIQSIQRVFQGEGKGGESEIGVGKAQSQEEVQEVP